MTKTKKYPKPFKDWLQDNTILCENGYYEQTTQYKILFPTIEVLYIWFRKEFENGRITKSQRKLLTNLTS